jgi:predicted PurR-regulated permease PerM
VHPVLVIVALLAGGRIGGIVGMLVSVPVAAFLKIQFEKHLAARKARMALQEQGDTDGMGD